jgi:YidC/Oxa1 family membrane protein insertase
MQIITSLFDTLFFGPIVNILVLLLRGLEGLGIPGALGIAIIIVTMLIRILVWPLMATQLKASKKMAELKPHLDELKKKHKDDKQALAKAQMDLYKEHGVNPAGGCLPLLIQIPPMIAIYQVIYAFFDGAHGLNRINGLLYNSDWALKQAPNLDFFGVSLAVKPSDYATAGLFILLVPVITALIQLIQSKMMTPVPVKINKQDSKKEKQEKESMEDAMASMQGQMMFIMPLMMAYISFTFPIGLALYLNTLTLVGIFQQYLISGWGSLGPWISKISSKNSK